MNVAPKTCHRLRWLYLLAVCTMPSVSGATTWSGGSANWNNVAFWNTGLVPGAGDDVFIDGGDLDTNSVVTVNVAANAGDLTVDPGDTLNIPGQIFSLFGDLLNVGGAVNIDSNGILVVRNGATLLGPGAVNFGATGGGNRLDIDGNNTLTVDAGGTIRGHSGTIGGQLFVGGTAALINNGLITADVTGGTITLTETAVTNNNLLKATNGGTLALNSAVSGGTIAADNGVVRQGGVRITASTVTTANGGVLRAISSSANYLDAAVIDGTLDLTSVNARERVVNGLTLNGTVNIDNNGILSFENSQTLDGTGTIVFGTSGAGNRLDLDGNGTTTIGTGITLRGQNGTIGQQLNIGGTQILLNNGEIAADVLGGTLTLVESAVVNNGILRASNGGTLILSSNVSGGVGSAIVADIGSTVVQNGVTLSGAINTSGNGIFRAVSSSGNFLSGVTLNGNLDLTSVNARERVTPGSLVVNGTIDINSNGILSFEGSGTVSGTGSIVFGATGPGNRLDLDGNGTTSLGAGITVHGHNGTIGQQLNLGGTQTLVNDGIIAADVAGGTITLTESAVTNNGVLRAINGGTLVLSSNVTGAVGSSINAGAGSTVVQNGVVLSGVINTSGNGIFRAISSSANYLNSATLNGTLDMTGINARERVTPGGLVLNGTIDINSNGILSLEGNGGLSGTGAIVFGATGPGNRLDLDGNGTSTIGSGITVRGQNGTIGQQLNLGGTQTLVNDGLIAADVAGGTITLTESVVSNNGVLRAINGGTLVLSSNVTGNVGSSINAGVGSTVLQNGVTLSGTINTSGDGIFRAVSSSANFLNGVTFNGRLDMTGTNARERVTAGGLALNGTVDINSNGILSFEGTGSLSGNGTVVFGDTGPGNRLDLDGNGATTIGAGVTVRGKNGSIGGQINIGGTQTLINDGTIAADVAGGTIALNESAVINNGVLRAGAGSTLALNSVFTNAETGLVTGEGTIITPAAGLVNAGHVAPGASPGTLTLVGKFAQTATGVLDIDIGTLLASDKLVVSGTAALGGTLALHCYAACNLAVGDTLTVLDAAANGLSGVFQLALFGFATGQFEMIRDLAQGDVRLLVTEAVTAAVPLPAAGWLLLGAVSALGTFVRRRR